MWHFVSLWVRRLGGSVSLQGSLPWQVLGPPVLGVTGHCSPQGGREGEPCTGRVPAPAGTAQESQR